MNEVELALRAARQEFEPSRSDRERVRRRLRASAAGLGVAASLATKSSAAATSLKLTLLFFGGMFVTLVGSSVVVAVMDGRTSHVAAPHAAAPRVVGAAPGAVFTPEPAISAAPSAPSASDRHPHAPAVPTPPAKSPASARSAAELEAELALLRETRRASASGNVQLAKQLLDRLDREHAQSSLLEERAALRAVTDCTSAAAFFQRYTASVYAAKVRRACHIETAPSAVPSVRSFSIY